jgi:phosphate-selective porin OprO/OprP
LYRNDENRVVQSVLFSGRYQHDFTAIDADQGDHKEGNVRRLRVGLKTRLFKDWTLHGEADLNPQEAEPLYTRLTDFYLMWSRGSELELTIGKHSAPFTIDGATSSKELLAVDRSNLTNNMWFPQEYMPGISAAGEVSSWNYHVGVYSSGAENREFGEFNGSVFTLAVLGYDFGISLGVDDAILAGNYVFQNPDPDNTFTRRLQHIVSVNFNLDAGRWGLRTDVSSAAGYREQGNIWGITTMPFTYLTEKFQVVGRYTYLGSNDANAVQLATYENRITSRRGDQYNEIYGGANYYFYDHKLKLQSGVQWADLNDRSGSADAYTGVSWVTGLRVSW